MWTKHLDAPGSAAWHARRADCFNAGDAAAALGCSPLKTRTQLMQELHTGLAREFSDLVQQRVIDPGHAIEAAMRPLAEEILGEELQVLAGTMGIAGLTRPLGASLDGLTFLDDTTWECKTINDELRAALPHAGRDSHALNDGKRLPKDKRVQMEQQLMVTGAGRALFSAGAINAAGEVIEERHAWYYPDPDLRAEIVAGWRQFDIDLAAYVQPVAVEKLVAEPVEALPAPVVQVSGHLTLTDNFNVFEQRLRAFLDTQLIRQPKTDEDFVNLDAQIKAMKQGRESIKAAKAQMLAQVQPIDQASKTADMLDKLLQANCSMAETLLKDEKERRRGEIVAGGAKALADHIAALNKRLGERYMPQVSADFTGVVKGLKSLSSMEDRVSTELARAKIAANEIADRIQINMQALVAAGDTAHFPDVATLVLKAPEDLRNTIAARAAETQRKLDVERARIRAEEEARAAEKVRQQQAAREAEARLHREAEARRQQAAQDAAAREQRDREEMARAAQERQAETPAVQSAPTALQTAANVHPLPTKAPAAPASPPTLRLGQINERIAPLSVDAAGLALLGIPHVATDKSAKLWHEASFPAIVDALIGQLVRAKLKQLEAA